MTLRMILVFALLLATSACGTKSALETPRCVKVDKANADPSTSSTASSSCDKLAKKQKNYSEPPNPIER